MSRVLGNKIIAIIGGSGYLGSSIAKLAADNGARVFCVSR